MSKIIDPYKLELIFSINGLNGPATPPPYDVQRWMDEGNIVSFSDPKVYFQNAEFRINGCPNWLIWFSQLYTVFYTGDLDNSSVCSFKLKDGSYVFPSELPFDRFWQAIKGKKFKVSIDPRPCFCVNKESSKVQCLPFNEISKIYEYVHNHILNGDIDAVKGMLKPTRCYDLVEI